MSKCIRCWWCTCNWSCTCTPQEIREYKVKHWYKVDVDYWTPVSLSEWKEIWDLNPEDYKWLTKEDAIRKFFAETWKISISQVELRKLLSYTETQENDSN